MIKSDSRLTSNVGVPRPTAQTDRPGIWRSPGDRRYDPQMNSTMACAMTARELGCIGKPQR